MNDNENKQLLNFNMSVLLTMSIDSPVLIE
jgi:hypothetical protein